VIELALADDHAAGVLAEVAREVLEADAELEVFGDARVLDVEAGMVEGVGHGVVFAAPLPLGNERGEAAEGFLVEAEGLANFAGGGLAAVGDDVGGHSGAEFAVALVNILDGLLAFFFRGKVEVDVGPLAAVFVEEALEEELHADGVDGRDFEGVADGGVGGRAATLDEDVVLFAVADDVPHDEEVAGEAEARDEGELVVDLFAGAGEEVGVVFGAVAAVEAFVYSLAEEGVHCVGCVFIFGDGVVGEFVAEVGELEGEALGDFVCVAYCFGEIAEEGFHFCGAAEVAVVVGGEEAAGVVEVDVMADGGEEVEDFAVVRFGVADAVGGDDGDLERAGEAEGGLVAGFLIAELVALELDVDIVAAVEVGELFEEGAGCWFASRGEGGGEWAFVAAGKADEAFGILGEVVEGGGAFGFGGLAHFELRDELAEVLIAGAGGAEEG
jgi:hypothetical protein